MALRNSSLLLYGYTIDQSSQYLDFKIGPSTTLLALLNLGYYSLSSLMLEVARALNVADPTHNYTVTADRTIAAGTQNRVTISSNGAYFQILFGSGVHSAANPASELGFLPADQTGATSYTGSFSSGTALIPVLQGYNYVAPTRNKKIFGNVNVSAIGEKEAIVYQLQTFWSVEFKMEPESRMETMWEPFFDWAIQQRKLEFTPDITLPSDFFEGTLETTTEDSSGLGFLMAEMLPQWPNLYQTGKLKFRKTVSAGAFII